MFYVCKKHCELMLRLTYSSAFLFFLNKKSLVKLTVHLNTKDTISASASEMQWLNAQVIHPSCNNTDRHVCA